MAIKGVFHCAENLFLPLTVEALQGKTCQDSLLSGGGRSVRAGISGGRVVPGEYFLVSTKPDTFCYPTVGKGENYQVCSVQYCVQQLCTVRCTHIRTD